MNIYYNNPIFYKLPNEILDKIYSYLPSHPLIKLIPEIKGKRINEILNNMGILKKDIGHTDYNIHLLKLKLKEIEENVKQYKNISFSSPNQKMFFEWKIEGITQNIKKDIKKYKQIYDKKNKENEAITHILSVMDKEIYDKEIDKLNGIIHIF
jgi:hypothetical protein